MNPQNKIPMWPLYAADAAMFLTAFLIALPNALSGQRMGLEQTALCVFMVFAAMFMLASPYIFDAIASKKGSTDFEKSASQKFSAAADAFEAIDAKFGEHAQNFAAIKESLDMIAEKFSGVKSAEKRYSDAIKTAELGIEYLKGEIGRLEKKLDDAEARQNKAEEEGSEISDEIDDIKSRMDSSDGRISELSGLAGRMDALEKLCRNLEASLKSDGEDETDGNLGDIDMLGKAMKSAGGFAGSRVGRLISASRASSNGSADVGLSPMRSPDGDFISSIPQEAEEHLVGDSVFDEEDLSDDEENDDDDSSERADEEFFYADDTDADDGNSAGDVFSQRNEDFPSDAEGEQPPRADAPQANGEDSAGKTDGGKATEDETLKEEDSAGEESPEAAVEDESPAGGKELPTEGDIPPTTDDDPSTQSEPALFDMEQSAGRAKAARKGQTSIIVNAMIGIGNKPYLRGDGGGLSPEKGVPMDFVEIGKWQWICPEEISEPLHLEVFVNDEIKLDAAQYSLSPNQKLEVNLIYVK